jgi:hypothetical protein
LGGLGYARNSWLKYELNLRTLNFYPLKSGYEPKSHPEPGKGAKNHFLRLNHLDPCPVLVFIIKLEFPKNFTT